MAEVLLTRLLLPLLSGSATELSVPHRNLIQHVKNEVLTSTHMPASMLVELRPILAEELLPSCFTTRNGVSNGKHKIFLRLSYI
jgi:hypothetical protein